MQMVTKTHSPGVGGKLHNIATHHSFNLANTADCLRHVCIYIAHNKLIAMGSECCHKIMTTSPLAHLVAMHILIRASSTHHTACHSTPCDHLSNKLRLNCLLKLAWKVVTCLADDSGSTCMFPRVTSPLTPAKYALTQAKYAHKPSYFSPAGMLRYHSAERACSYQCSMREISGRNPPCRARQGGHECNLQ